MADVLQPQPEAVAAPPAAESGGRPWWIALAVVLGAVVAAYLPEITDLLDTWSENPDYTHGYLIAPVAVAILYQRWPGLSAAFSRPSLVGWLLVVAALALRTYCHETGRPWIEQVTLFPLIIGLALALGGWRLMRWAWPGLAYLIFLFPLPGWLNLSVSAPLQRFATICTTRLIRVTGLWVMSEGNVIHIGSHPLEVARACNGLSMLMSLAATITALVALVPMSTWRRVILLASIVPVALLSNVLRITVTAWCYYFFGAEVGEGYAHTWAGLLMMPLALALVGTEMMILSWLVDEREVVVDDRPMIGIPTKEATAPPAAAEPTEPGPS